MTHKLTVNVNLRQNDLMNRARDYLTKVDGITKGEWDEIELCVDESPHMQPQPFFYISRKNDRGFQASYEDQQAFLLTPVAKKLIEDLVVEVASLKTDISILKNIDVYKRLADR